jgi:hypothetical protein
MQEGWNEIIDLIQENPQWLDPLFPDPNSSNPNNGNPHLGIIVLNTMIL